jgi:Tfp pilus assembly protein PilF
VSLLLEALKKAELAKQQGAAGQPGVPATPGPDAGLPPITEAPPADLAAEKPLITRDRLPDITQPLEILSEDLPSAAAPKRERPPASASPEPVGAPGARSAPGLDRPERAASAPSGTEQDRASARQLFEAKTPDYDPRRPFYYALGVVGVFALGIAGYFAYQIFAPRPAYYTGPPAGTPAPTTTAAVTPPPAAAPSAPAQAQPAQTAQATTAPAATPGAEPTSPAAAAPTTSAQPVPVPPQPRPAAPKAGPDRGPAAASTRPARAGATAAPGDGTPAPARSAAPGPAVRVTPSGARVDPAVERGWQALQAGNLQQARDEYARALRANPNDRDALLGLAAIDMRSQDFASAEARYVRVLDLDPKDAYAQAALIALRGQTDPVQAESRLKTLVAQQPDANVLSFTLGNQYAAQRRWADAQQAYFKALAGDPENADYAFNLAVSLDHLRQPKLALEYYQRALTLAGSRPVGFNTAQVEARVRELQRQ